MNCSLKKLREDFENGTIKENEMTEEQKQLLINLYEKRNQELMEKIVDKKRKLHKIYANMKK